MASNDYHFITQWRVKATPAEAMDIIANPPDLPRWWPSVYIEAKELERGKESDLHAYDHRCHANA